LSDEQVEVDRRGPPRGARGESFLALGCRIMAAGYGKNCGLELRCQFPCQFRLSTAQNSAAAGLGKMQPSS
jgi:hypothetical protein